MFDHAAAYDRVSNSNRMPGKSAITKQKNIGETRSQRILFNMSVCEGVNFTELAREWRCKWSGDNDKASLIALQQTLNTHMSALKAVDGCVRVQRIVCGGCQDFKIITTVASDKFATWEANGFAPEKDFLAAMSGIDGAAQVETQTYTIAEYKPIV